MARLLSRVVAVAFVALLGAGAPVHAQSYSWDGIYVGTTIGGAIYEPGNNTLSTTCPPTGYFCNSTGKGSANAGIVNITWPALSAFTWSGQAGYNWQYRSVVLGPEVDIGYFNLHSTPHASAAYPVTGILGIPPATKSSPATTYTVAESLSTDGLVMLRGRIGWAPEAPTLFYVNFGLAFTELRVGNSFADTNGASGAASGSSTIGWTAGVGAELAVTHAWTIKVEYVYLDFGTTTATGNITHGGFSNGLTSTVDLSTNIFRAGVNFRFNPP